MRFEPLPSDLADSLGGAAAELGPFGQVAYCPTVGSTNDLALALALAGKPEGTAVVADEQRAGRGRRGRAWFSPAEAGLYLSVVVRPPAAATGLTLVTLGAGVAAARAIEAVCGLSPELKWPNDIVVGRPWRKVGGILSEAVTSGSRLDAIVIGYGLNLRPSRLPRELVDRATALETELGRPVDRAPLLIHVLRETRTLMAHLHVGDVDWVGHAWRRYGSAGLSGSVVRWKQEGIDRRGRPRDIDIDGALVVETETGVDRVIAGEVVWETLASDG